MVKRISKKVYKKKRSTRRKSMMVRRVPRPMASSLVTKRINYIGNWTFSSALTSGFWRYFSVTMANYNNFAEMAAVFDEYKVNAIKLTLRPRYDSVEASSTATFPQAYVHYIIDPGTTLAPSGTYASGTLNTFLENDGVKTRTLNRPVSIYFRPKVSDQVFGGGTASRVVNGGWIKTTETAVDFRGIHIFLQGNNFTNVGTQCQLDQFVTFYCSFRNPK